MFQTILMYLCILLIGAIVGRFVKFGDKLNKFISSAQFICLLGLLFFMGVNLGLDEAILKNVGAMGLDASIFSVFTIGFSVLGIFIYRKIFMKGQRKDLQEANDDN